MLPERKFEHFEIYRQPDYTYKLHPDRGVVEGHTDGKEAVEQAIYKILSTERYQYPTYSSDYGVELVELFGEPMSWVIPEAERRITEALMQDDRIDSITDWQFEKDGERLAVYFVAHSIHGDVEIEKEIRV